MGGHYPSPPMSDLVLSEDHGPVRHLVLNRPEKRNAFHDELVLATGTALRAAAEDPAVRVVVVRGAGPLFSSGMDLGSLGALSAAPEQLRTFRRHCLEAWNLAEEMPKPVICAIHGACIGGALELALACDFRVLAADAIVGMPETRIGLIPDVGGSSRLPQVVGLGRAKELVMTGKLIGAEEAERIGLATRVAPAGRARRRRHAARGRAAGVRAAGGGAGQAGDGRLGAAGALDHARARGAWRRSAAPRRPTSPRAPARSPRSACRSSAAPSPPSRRGLR